MDANDGKVRFFAIEHGAWESWEQHFILAASAQDAANQYIRRRKHMLRNVLSNSVTEAYVYETDFDEFGTLRPVGDDDYTSQSKKPVLKIEVPN